MITLPMVIAAAGLILVGFALGYNIGLHTKQEDRR